MLAAAAGILTGYLDLGQERSPVAALTTSDLARSLGLSSILPGVAMVSMFHYYRRNLAWELTNYQDSSGVLYSPLSHNAYEGLSIPSRRLTMKRSLSPRCTHIRFIVDIFQSASKSFVLWT